MAPADGHNTTGQFDPSLHGTSGPLFTSLPGFPAGTDHQILNATSQLSEFPFKLDANGGKPLGISRLLFNVMRINAYNQLGWLHSTIGKSVRSSASTAYLLPNSARENLDILVNTYVTKLLPTARSSCGTPSFRTVEFAQKLGQGSYGTSITGIDPLSIIFRDEDLDCWKRSDFISRLDRHSSNSNALRYWGCARSRKIWHQKQCRSA